MATFKTGSNETGIFFLSFFYFFLFFPFLVVDFFSKDWEVSFSLFLFCLLIQEADDCFDYRISPGIVMGFVSWAMGKHAYISWDRRQLANP